MSTSTPSARSGPTPAELFRVRLASGIGSTIEWYLSFAYISAAGLIFSTQYFGALGPNALIVSLGSVAASFIASPLGGIIAGHFGDRYGRKATLIGTLALMGLASLGMGVLPTYDQIGVAAPLLLVIFRFMQGLSTGGEWGGAALMSIEYAPARRRGFYGVFSQIGTPAGLVLSTGVFFLVQLLTTPEQFAAWGWRVPFFISVLLVVIGLKIRTSISESPAFTEFKESSSELRVPLKDALQRYWWQMILAAGSFVANILAGYLLIGYLLSYTSNSLNMDSGVTLFVLMLAALIWIGATVLGGFWSDRLGRRRMMAIGYVLMGLWIVPMFMLVDTRSIIAFAGGVFVLAVALGLSYGPQSAMFAELFPTRLRYTAASLPYAVGGIVGGGFAPAIAEWLLQTTGTSLSIGGYVIAFVLISLSSLLLLRDSYFTGFPDNSFKGVTSPAEVEQHAGEGGAGHVFRTDAGNDSVEPSGEGAATGGEGRRS
ncbi:MFS transporter [Prauserella halophila]|uniref:MFS transporter n=1 Tax=Prauserella halophila TaxID=185641 RepID=A0ABP4H711_9PSEU|nr:MFS transporter [Prauserella halophila]MCP2238140.1 Sugar phosphate permease [Prauserella halophila]